MDENLLNLIREHIESECAMTRAAARLEAIQALESKGFTEADFEKIVSILTK